MLCFMLICAEPDLSRLPSGFAYGVVDSVDRPEIFKRWVTAQIGRGITRAEVKPLGAPRFSPILPELHQVPRHNNGIVRL
jgi:hypothetical protein